MVTSISSFYAESKGVYRCLHDYNLVPGDITDTPGYSLYTIDDMFRDIKEIQTHYNEEVTKLGLAEKNSYSNTIFSTKGDEPIAE